jgi:hypothetical protein
LQQAQVLFALSGKDIWSKSFTMSTLRLAGYVIAVAGLVLSAAWLLAKPDFEPAVAFFGTLGILVSLLASDNQGSSDFERLVTWIRGSNPIVIALGGILLGILLALVAPRLLAVITTTPVPPSTPMPSAVALIPPTAAPVGAVPPTAMPGAVANSSAPSLAPTPTKTSTPTVTPTPEPPTLTPTPTPETTPPGTILGVRQTWKQGGVELTLKEVSTFPDHLQVIFELTNQNAHEISVEYNDTDNFIASDNRNRQLQTCFPYFGCEDSGGFVLQPGESAAITGSRTSYGLYILVNTGDRGLSEVILKVVNISGISEAQWRIPINH